MNEPPTADRILLVDDNPTNLKVLYEALEAEGYELLIASSGAEALEIAGAARPSLVLLDINMPGMDGYETCRKLKAAPGTRDSAVIYLSARGEVEDKLKGFDTGAVDYIGKPFSFEEVVARVRTHLASYHRQRDLERRLSLGFADLDDGALAAKIAAGEGEEVEFKSTLRVNLRTGKSDKRMENACLKTIAGYLNSAGGLLMIGVDDDGGALGLANDGFANEDKFLLHLNTLIGNHLGGEVAQFTRTTIRAFGGERIALVECLRSPNPVFFRRENDEFFYVRSGPSTKHLTPSEVLAYLDGRG